MARKELKLPDCDIQIEKTVWEKWPRGRRSAKTQPTIKESHWLKVGKTTRDVCACEEFLCQESCFVPINNETGQLSDVGLLKTYKGQQMVENSFRELKSPQLASVMYLKSPGGSKC